MDVDAVRLALADFETECHRARMPRMVLVLQNAMGRKVSRFEVRDVTEQHRKDRLAAEAQAIERLRAAFNGDKADG